MNETIDFDTLDTTDGAEAFELLCASAVLDPEVIDEARKLHGQPETVARWKVVCAMAAASYVIDQVRSNVAHGCGQVTERTYTALRDYLRTVTFADLR